MISKHQYLILYAYAEDYLAWLSIWAFYIGACVGSFLNVVIWRLPQKMSLFFVRSHCPQCKQRIRVWENIPIFAWIFLLGRCRHCKNPIPPRYLFMEVLTGFMFFAIWFHAWRYYFLFKLHPQHPFWPVSLVVAYLTLISFLLVLSGIDIDYQEVPDSVVVTGITIAFLLALAFPETHELLTPPGKLSNLQHKPILFLVVKWLTPVQKALLNSSRLLALLDWALGILWGGGILWIMGEVMKKIRGKKRFRLDPYQPIVITGLGYINEENQSISWKELFARSSDVMVIKGLLNCIEFRVSQNGPIDLSNYAEYLEFPQYVEATIDLNGVTINQDLFFSHDQIERITFLAKEYVIPLEPLGLGDVTLMAMIGAFLGPGPILPIFLGACVLGSLFGLIKICFFRAKFYHGFPFVPFITAVTFAYILLNRYFWTWVYTWIQRGK